MAATPPTTPFIGLSCLCILALALTAGCTGIGFGEATYTDGALQLEVDNPSEPTEATLQVTVVKTSGFGQEQVDTFVKIEHFQEGTNIFSFPVALEPGTYKLYLYLLKGDERTAAVIRDLQV
ncbi:hypothetical protein E2N92_01975 [Methanofollis formosanus]|uniref:Uncharacterized protein n=1 Tax=Methanofollis formosanus TaxID=299308 RepID=A0A8G1EFM1_9EURY|nr:hypothetical protein [Methanofollis formosanus]QYZ78284.1 hypothetical protein E2N92_01975 [Methanofollis formosanus]